jgi:hypothetical protein
MVYHDRDFFRQMRTIGCGHHKILQDKCNKWSRNRADCRELPPNRNTISNPSRAAESCGLWRKEMKSDKTVPNPHTPQRRDQELDRRYGAIGISAVAAAMRYQSIDRTLPHIRERDERSERAEQAA